MGKPAVILIAPCILAAQLQAEQPDPSSHWGTPFIKLLRDHDVELLCLPCTETGFCGVPRKKHGVDYYQTLNGYLEYCEKQAGNMQQRLLSLNEKKKDILACIGVEHSPSCAVSYMYTHRGTVKRAGIFFEQLFTKINETGIKIEWIGINRRYPQKAYNHLRKLLERWESECR